MTEVGRQPFVVYGVMRTSQAVTGAGGIPVGYATLGAVYLGLAGAVWIVERKRRKSMAAKPQAEKKPPSSPQQPSSTLAPSGQGS